MSDMIKLSFELAKEIAYFDMYKVLNGLQKRVERGGFVSQDEKAHALQIAQHRTETLHSYGTSYEDLRWILNEWKQNPLSKKSCSDKAKWQSIVEELEALIAGDIPEEDRSKQLLQVHGYSKEESALILETAQNFVDERVCLTLYDAVEMIVNKLKK